MNRSSEQEQILLKSIAKAQTLVSEAKSNRVDQNAFAFTLWKAAAEAEYAAFQIAATFGYEDYHPTNLNDQEGDELETAEKLLREAQKSLLEEPRQSYASVRGAVSLLRKLYGAEEKASSKENVSETVDE